MRKTEKFYENFNNLKVSPEQAAERFEFKDVKTLDGLSSKAKSKTAVVTKAVNAELDASDEWRDAMGIADKQEQKHEKSQDNYAKVEKENRKRLDDALKSIKQEMSLFEKLMEKRDKLGVVYNDKSREARAALADGKSLVGQMESGISAFISSAKALGVDVSGKVSKYNAIKDKLDLEIQKGT
tara:strand:+ start:75 stop:623 length:549 start_codon:yes stop_codon:yes gene_type:complete